MLPASPTEFGRFLRDTPAAARPELERLCGRSLRHVVDWAWRRYRYDDSPETVLRHTLRWAELYLISRPLDWWHGLLPGKGGWDQLVGVVTVAAGRLLHWDPHADRRPTAYSPEPLSATGGGYEVHATSLPKRHASGDVPDCAFAPDAVWLLLTDVSGKGWPAFILAQGIGHLWHSQLDGVAILPTQLLDRMQRILKECLPEGIYAETVTVRLPQTGRMVAAGCGYLILRPKASAAGRREALTGRWLGDIDFRDPDIASFEPIEADLATGDQLALVSDGFLNQPTGAGTLESELPSRLAAGFDQLTLHDALLALATKALETNEQDDDITVLCAVRRPNDSCGENPGGEDSKDEDGEDARARFAAILDNPKSQNCRHCDETPFDCRGEFIRFLQEGPAGSGPLMTQLRPLVFYCAKKIFPDDHALWGDMVDEGFLQILCKLRLWRGECPLCKFAATVAARKMKDLKRRPKPPFELIGDEGELRADPASAEEIAYIKVLIEQLEPRLRQIVLGRLEGKTDDEIATEVRLSRTTIQRYLRVIREDLAQ